MIKNNLKILIVTGFLLLNYNCTNRSSIPNIQNRESNESFITIDVDSPEPEYEAMFQLLFRGIANSSRKTPLIGINENAAKNSNPAYFNSFFKKGRYKTFIISSTKNNNSSRRIVINLRALESDLEYNAIIRKFGY